LEPGVGSLGPAHRTRNLAAKVPHDLWPEFKARAAATHKAQSSKIARELAEGVVDEYGRDLANAVNCYTDDFDACIAHLDAPDPLDQLTENRRCRSRAPRRPAAAREDWS
jgi:hypothetical protein